MPQKHKKLVSGRYWNLAKDYKDEIIKSYKINVFRPEFHDEKYKSRLINLLLDIYYEKGLLIMTDSEDIIEDFKEIKELAEIDPHIHHYEYIDKGNPINIEGYIYRFCCKSCGEYKQISEKNLKKGINDTVSESEQEKPSLNIPSGDGNITGVKSEDSSYGT